VLVERSSNSNSNSNTRKRIARMQADQNGSTLPFKVIIANADVVR